MGLKKLKKNSVFKFLASLKLAVILLISLAAILAVATFYESAYDTKTAQYLVYKSPLFAVFLLTLGINLLCSALMRFPWKKSQTGFVITHMGIITILIGSLATMFSGVDGSMALEEGETSAKVTIDQPVLYFGRDVQKVREIPAEYRWNRPKPGTSEHRYPLDEKNKLVAVIDNYYHHAKADTVYLPDDQGTAAIQLRLHNENVDQKLWLTPAGGRVNLGPASLDFFRLPDQEALERFQQGGKSEGRGKLQLLLDESPEVVDLDRLEDKAYPLEDGTTSVKLIRYLPFAVVEDGELISRSEEPQNPAVEIEISTKAGSQRWLLFALLPELNTRLSSEGDEFALRVLYQRDQAAEARLLEVALDPEGNLHYRVDRGQAKPIKPGEAVPTGWMNIQAEVLDFVPKGRKEKQLTEVFPQKGKEDKAPGPAIRLTLEGASEPGPYWLERGDIKRIPDQSGDDLVIGYGYKTVPLGFDIKLKDFRIGYDPGTETAASYESDVEVGEEVHTIAMNEPLHKNGYTVFQASFSKSPSGGDISVFSIANDPGIELKYLGSIMLVLGIIIMFYFKPKKRVRVQKSQDTDQGALS